MKTLFRLSRLLVLLAGLTSAEAVETALNETEPLRVRLTSLSRHDLRILRLERGLLYLRPVDTEVGELVVPLVQAKDLQFVLSAAYERARQWQYQGRQDEALPVVRQWAMALRPFLAAPDSNALPVVGAYLELLVQQRQWETAWEFLRPMPFDVVGLAWPERLVQVALGLKTQGSIQTAVTIVSRLPVGSDRTAGIVEAFAHELRRQGEYAGAGLLYERLPAPADPAAGRQRQLELAYVEFHQGLRRKAEARIEEVERWGETGTVNVLQLLVRGHLLLAAQRPDDALDVLARGIVVAGGMSEWAVELATTSAQAYRAAGQADVADRLEEDLQHLLPSAARSSVAPPVEHVPLSPGT